MWAGEQRTSYMEMFIDTDFKTKIPCFFIVIKNKNYIIYNVEDYLENFLNEIIKIFKIYKINFIYIDQRGYGLGLLEKLIKYCNNSNVDLIIVNNNKENTILKIKN